jgi:serine/threonine-protein kinase 24/25/MST4
MAKKTNYLTELIERHERWKAEGGDKQDDEEKDLVSDLYVYSHLLLMQASHFSNSPASVDPEDLWDFGTVRHSSRPTTIGRSNPGPPLTWENNSTTHSDISDASTTRRGSGSGSSGSSKHASSVTAKGALPPLPPTSSTPQTPTKQRFEQSTVRNVRSPGGPDASGLKSSQGTIQREPSDDYEDYEDQYEYPKPDGLEHKVENLQLDHEDASFLDTAMLDSVILPAIASVRISGSVRRLLVTHYVLCSCSLEWPRRRRE